MPTASVTLDRDSQGSQESLDPLQKLLNLVEKKIRNLEKRKNKLEQYRNDLQAGKELIEDQKQAVASFDSVIANLDLMRDMSQHFNVMIADHNKWLKQQTKQEALQKHNEEISRIKEILKIQDVLQLMGQDEVRADFLAGTNGAVVMPPENLEHLDSLFKLVTPSRTEGQEAQEFQKEVQGAAEHMMLLLEGKNSEVAGTTYKKLLNIVNDIASCSYPERKEVDAANDENLVESLPEEVPEYTNGVVEESDEIAAVAEVAINSIASDGPPPGLTTSAVTPVQPPIVPQEKTPIVAPAQEALAAAMAQIPTPTLPGAPPQTAPGMPPTPSFFTQPSHTQPESLQAVQPPVPQPAPPQQVPVQAPVQPPVQPQPPVQAPVQPPVQTPVPTPVQSVQASLQQISLSDLVSPGSFDFLQESQVAQEPPAVYMDPAVVSIGSIKTDSVSQKLLSPVQPQQPPPATPVVSLAQEHTHPSNIPAQNYTNQTYSNINLTNYSQGVASVYPTNADIDTTSNPPSALPLSSQPRTSSQVEFNPEARPWTSDQSTPAQETVVNIPQGHDDSSWGPQDMPVNGGDDKWANDAGTWDEYDDNQGGSQMPPNNSHGDYERRGGYRGRSRGFVPRGGFRGNRGGGGGNGGGSGGYQNGRGGYGGGGYGGGGYRGRGGMNGPRGRGGFRGGQGPRGNFRGGRGGPRPSYQQPHMMQ